MTEATPARFSIAAIILIASCISGAAWFMHSTEIANADMCLPAPPAGSAEYNAQIAQGLRLMNIKLLPHALYPIRAQLWRLMQR